MLKMCGPIFLLGKAVVLDSGFCVTKSIKELKEKGVYMENLIKKWRYWSKVVTSDLFDNHFEDKYVGDVGMVDARTEDNKLFKIFCIK